MKSGILILLQMTYSMTNGEYFVSVDCKSQPQASYQYCNASFSPELRATDLVNRLTLAELIGQTSSIAPAIPRLGIKDYNWRSNCRHGWSASGGHWRKDLNWTVFPAPISLGATFDPDLVYKVGAATSDEGRALHNEMLQIFNGSSTEAAALNCFAPIVNLIRDPRWGRCQESFSEDPYHLSLMGAAYMKGIQMEGESKYWKIAASVPMYAVHSGPDNIRADFTAQVTLHDLYDTYLEAFKSQVYEANVSQIMAAYSGLNCTKSPDGAPDSANVFLLKDVLRTQFEAPNISIISDNGAISEVYATHHFVKTPVEAAALCMNATTDLDLGHDQMYTQYLQKALEDKLVNEDTIKQSVWRSMLVRIRLGDFDPIEMVPYQKIDKSHLNTEANQNLNILAAQKSFVLIKNVDNFLPISKERIKKLAIIGPNADAGQTQLSNYAGIPDKVVSILDGIKAEVGRGVVIAYESGCKDTSCTDDSGFSMALDTVKDSDYVIMVMGLDDHLEGESHDRVNHSCKGEIVDILALPGCQGMLVDEIAKINKNTILILMNGGPISLGTIYQNINVQSILEVFYPGALGGTAVANVLFGHYNPAGRMPMTTYLDSTKIPISTNYSMTASPGRTYRYHSGVIAVPFGFGLSYTFFKYSNFIIFSKTLKQCDSQEINVDVTNVGKMAGDEVVQVYFIPPVIKGKNFFPKVQLVGFSRRNIEVGAVATFSFTINPYHLSLVDENGERFVFPGNYTVLVGGTLPGFSVAGGGIEGVSGLFIVDGDNPIKLSDCQDVPKCIIC